MKYTVLYLCVFWYCAAIAQTTFPENGPQHIVQNQVAFIHATLHTNYNTKIDDATLLVEGGKVIYAGKATAIPKGYLIYNATGKHIYPAFIEMYSNYGVQLTPEQQKSESETKGFVSTKKGAYHWNEAIRAEFNAASVFSVDEKKAKQLRSSGFALAVTSVQDGICRGSAALVYTAKGNEHELIVAPRVAATFSFSRGSSKQHYPSSLMGSIALLRQTYYDASWYKKQNKEVNLTLQAFGELQTLPAIFVSGNKLNSLRVAKLGNEFNTSYIIKGSGDEYQRLQEIKATQLRFIVPVDFPKPFEVEDPFVAEYIHTADLKHWELAPYNIRMLLEQKVPLAITADGCEDASMFLKNLKKAVQLGAPEAEVLKALTYNPALWLKQEKLLGALTPGMVANCIVTDGPLFAPQTVILETWVKGIPYLVNEPKAPIMAGVYTIDLPTLNGYKLHAKSVNGKAEFALLGKDTITVDGNYTSTGFQLLIKTNQAKDSLMRIDGWPLTIDSSQYPYTIQMAKGLYKSNDGNFTTCTFNLMQKAVVNNSAAKIDSVDLTIPGKVWFPFTDYGQTSLPQQQTYLITNATIWTNEQDSVLLRTDLLIKDGKIAAIGKNLSAKGAVVIDAKGKHITAGIIDEHSHIAISNGVNEGTQSSSAEVRIGDVLNSEDINMYRQLSGGVVAAQLLHGSANPIGGQSALIKFRWGNTPEQLKINGADGFIKFALGENVKQSNWGDRNVYRYPQTRMGVEQIMFDAFQRARDYEKLQKENPDSRKDLELEATLEILRGKRFITCHSYVQSEINMLMHLADSFGFRVNTFTHILEGYKVAPQMKKHGVSASTFADWWAYKYEVMEAIPYNAAILQQMGINTAINSDDAEMGRRLNQEAAKAIKYGGVTECEAIKMVTLNPAKALHLDAKMGSIKVGKDADIVIWTDHPLSIYAMSDYTFVDGILLFERSIQNTLHEQIKLERERIIQKMIKAKQSGEKAEKKRSKVQDEYHCDDEEE